MTAVALHLTQQADRLVERLADGASTLVVGGAAGSGRSGLLEAAARRLRDAGKSPVLVAPPERHVDTPALALIDLGVGLAQAGLLEGDLEEWKNQGSWRARKGDARRWLQAEQVGRQSDVVILCDDPRQWAIADTADLAARASATASLVLREAKCQKVVVGAPHDFFDDELVKIDLHHASAAMLADESAWGVLWPIVDELRDRVPALGAKSPSHIQLAVAYASLVSAGELADWWRPSTSSDLLASRLALMVSRERSLRALWNFWLRVSIPRRAVPRGWMEPTLGLVPAEVQRHVAETCLIVPNEDVRPLREVRGAASHYTDTEFAATVLKDGAREFLQRYVGAFENDTQERRPTAFVVGAEAIYMASRLGDAAVINEVAPNFSQQLDAMGLASIGRSDWRDARNAFELAIQWDAEDAFAHHHLGFALDAAAEEPRRIESAYQTAIALNAAQASWHARLISFLVVRARMEDARNKWQEARAALTSDGGTAPPELYDKLHLPVAAILLRRNELLLAREVLDDVPMGVRPLLRSYDEHRQRLEILEAAQDEGAYVPARRLRAEWWQQGPELLGQRLTDGRELRAWIAGRIDEVDEFAMHVSVAIVDGPTKPEYGTMTIELPELAALVADTDRIAGLRQGQFLEIGVYGDGNDSTSVVRIIPDEPWTAGIETQLDPDRFLRRTKWA